MKRVWHLMAVIIGVSVLSACGTSSSSNPNNEPARLARITSELSAKRVWTRSIGSGGGASFSPVVVGDAVYAATPNGVVIKVDVNSGKTVWRKRLRQPLSAGVGADGQFVAVVSKDAHVIVLDDSGTQLWRVRTSSEVNIPPLVADGLVAVRAGDYRIQAFEAASGTLRWSLQRPGPALALRTNMQMRMLDRLILTGLPNGKLLAIDSASGDTRWEGTVALSRGATDLERIIDVVGAPQAQGSVLCAAAYQGQITCFDVAQGGAVLWQQAFSTVTGLGSDEVQVYAANTRDIVSAYGIHDGELAWTQDSLRNRRLSAPAVIRSALAFGDLQGHIHFLSREDGHLLGRVRVGSDAIVSPLIAASQGIVGQTQGGRLFLVRAD